ncbi:hypothetical protein [Chryseobacterium potabilaquae]|uniref:Uncharacterized protein n=1 Tax=Chryseobacterium potabilaquae TaxID=2675057 RepID=A0A6N4WZE8_9FLAO|nr:hypothetical protein [Chryseobacterium potabilaquae]CAA7193830.1 hypothetical protein CHRY9293_00241 [Chryseobacterium potabilaquae]
MKSTGNSHIDNLIFDLKSNMEGYMIEFEPSYTQNDINECIALLFEYVIEIFKTKLKNEAMGLVKSTILSLNNLNDRCDGSLIETNEREQIAEIVILASHEMGYNSVDEDITEEWRDF